MKHLFRQHTYLLLILSLLNSCNIFHTPKWIISDGNVRIWAADIDTTAAIIWTGGEFEGLANGEGIFKCTNKDGVVLETPIKAFYGAINEDDIVKLDDGSKYVGETRDGNFEGFGVLENRDDLYIGYFSKSAPNGKAKWYKNGKLWYEGEWLNGQFNGEGTYYGGKTIKSGHWKEGKLIETEVDVNLANGHYKGTILNDQPSGYGVMEYSLGQRYSGKWKNGKWNGKGIFVSQEDSINGFWKHGKLNGFAYHKTKNYTFKGDYTEGLPDGIGTFTGTDSTKYSGSWSEGKMCGEGILHFPNKDVYEGQWGNGVQSGVGKYTYASNGAYYDGEWENGLQHGYGIYHSSAFEYIGFWNEGWMTGKGKITFPNHDFYEGDFVENVKFGQGHYQYANGNSYDGEFVNDTFNGLGVFKFKDGSVYEGEFHNGKICGDGTLYVKSKEGIVAITSKWDGNNSMPTIASILFPNGDLYEGKLVNGLPTIDGNWSSEKERKSGKTIMNSVKRANEFYKKHRETIDKVVTTTSIVLSIVDVGGKVLGTALLLTPCAPIGGAILAVSNAASIANNVLLATHAATSTASAAIDVADAVENGGDVKESIKQLGKVLAQDVALYATPKLIKKIPAKKVLGKMSKYAKNTTGVVRSSVIVIGGKKLFAKMFNVTRDKYGKITRSTAESTVKNAVKKAVKKKPFKSAYMASRITKTLLNKQLQKIIEKGPIKLSKRTFKQIEQNPEMAKNIMRRLIKEHTDNNNFQEFFIRLALKNPKQVKRLLANKEIKKYINDRIRAGGVHEWLMTKRFEDFLTNPKWFKKKWFKKGSTDGYYLILAQTKLVQNTRNLKFKFGGGHVGSGRVNSQESVLFHKGLDEVIEKSNTIEEVFVNVRKYAKEVLTEDSYKEFNEALKATLASAAK